jgi:vancomycin resistance protein YoaR
VKSRWLIPAAVFAVGAASLAALGAASPPERLVSEFRTSLEGRNANQRHNAALAAKTLNGTIIAPGETFSFNKRFGGWTRDRGYRRAPVSYDGVLIDAWGGGVCQASTTLYNAALLAGLPIVARHAHHFAPGYVAPGRDAAVAYPNVDLSFTNTFKKRLVIHARIEGTSLIIQLEGQVPKTESVAIRQRVIDKRVPNELTFGVGRYGRIRAPGKPGWQVETIRSIGGRQERLSVDSYPAMPRVVEYE